MVMEITQSHNNEVMTYSYLYLQVDEAPLLLHFLTSDQGERNPDQNMIGKCLGGYYFNSKTGDLNEKSLLNIVNENGTYQVLYAKDLSIFLECHAVQSLKFNFP